MRSLRSITKDVFGENPKIIILSPWDLGLMAKDWILSKKQEFIDYTIEVKKAQIDFQNAIQNAGISEISQMSTQEVLQTFADRQKVWARGVSSDQPLVSPCEPQNEVVVSPPAP